MSPSCVLPTRALTSSAAVDQSLPSEVHMVPPAFCLFLAVLTYFSFLSTFAWMTVMAFDVCCAFR